MPPPPLALPSPRLNSSSPSSSSAPPTDDSLRPHMYFHNPDADDDCSSGDDEETLERRRHNRLISEVGRYERQRKRHLFLVQVVLSVAVVCFCMIRLAIDYECTSASVFLPIVTSILGYWLPAPRP